MKGHTIEERTGKEDKETKRERRGKPHERVGGRDRGRGGRGWFPTATPLSLVTLKGIQG